jgi:hypothetical protein
VPRLIDLEEVNGSNFTEPVPALIEPVKLKLLVRIVIAVLVTAMLVSIDNADVVEVEESKTIETAPEEVNVEGLNGKLSSFNAPDLVALNPNPPDPAEITVEFPDAARSLIGSLGPEPVKVIRFPTNS